MRGCESQRSCCDSGSESTDGGGSWERLMGHFAADFAKRRAELILCLLINCGNEKTVSVGFPSNEDIRTSTKFMFTFFCFSFIALSSVSSILDKHKMNERLNINSKIRKMKKNFSSICFHTSGKMTDKCLRSNLKPTQRLLTLLW